MKIHVCMVIQLYGCMEDNKPNVAKMLQTGESGRSVTTSSLEREAVFSANSMSFRSLNKLKFLLIVSNYCVPIICYGMS